MSTIYQLPGHFTGTTDIFPTFRHMVVGDNLAAVTTAGYLNSVNLESFPILPTDIINCLYSFNPNTNTGSYVQLSVSITNGVITLSNVADTTSGPFVTTTNTSSASPGTIRSITGKMVETATTLTSGNIVGVRGEVDYVGASGGFVYGTQGKLIPTGTLSGSDWNAAVFAQLDWSAAIINVGQVACVWADMGATSGTATDVTGLRMFAGTNTTAATANSMIYLYGKATNLFELSGSSSTYISTGAATPSGTIKKLAITIDGVTYYILAATVWS